jgi:hypothetical protein
MLMGSLGALSSLNSLWDEFIIAFWLIDLHALSFPIKGGNWVQKLCLNVLNMWGNVQFL